MKRKVFFICVLLALILAFGAFYFFYLQNPNRQVLALVNGEKITVYEFNKEIEKIESPLRDMIKEDPQSFLENLIIKRILLQDAKKQGITPPLRTYKDVSKEPKPLDELIIEELLKKKFPTPPSVSKEEIKAVYLQIKDQLSGKPLEDVSPEIENLIRENKREYQIRQYVTEIRTNASVEIDQIRLKKIASIPPKSNTEEEFRKALSGGKPILVDFGANSCLPCRQMRPILKELEKEYAGKAEILVIDVYKYQNLAREFKIQLIPTLIFFDAQGKEVFRHMGIMEKDKIISKLKEIGMKI